VIAHADRALPPKPQIALAQLRAALAAGVAPGVVLMDARFCHGTPPRL
jgi:SRSO17 transposase